MGSRRPKKEKHVKSTSPQAITTSTASAIDGDTHDRIVGNLKMELDGWQTKAKFNEDLAERTKQDALEMAADYKSRFDTMDHELRVALASRDQLSIEKQKLIEHYEHRIATINNDHGKAVKRYRNNFEDLTREFKTLGDVFRGLCRARAAENVEEFIEQCEKVASEAIPLKADREKFILEVKQAFMGVTVVEEEHDDVSQALQGTYQERVEVGSSAQESSSGEGADADAGCEDEELQQPDDQHLGAKQEGPEA
jgi:hypothetical protein